MIDWEGLLKFTLQYTDGTQDSNFQEMSTENKKWLEKAIQEYSHSEVHRIQKILQTVLNYSDMKEEELLDLLEELQELLDSLDKGSTLYSMQGHIVLLKVIFFCSFESCRVVALQIYGAANQNDAGVQN